MEWNGMEWNRIDKEEKTVLEYKATENISCGPFIATNLYDTMRRANRSSIWCELKFRINHVVAHNCTLNHIYSILDYQAETRRL